MNIRADMLDLIRSRTPGLRAAAAVLHGSGGLQGRHGDHLVSRLAVRDPACEIPQTGNFVTMQVGDYAIVIVRGADGMIRAFHNACRHRGSRVCTAHKGSAPKLVCPYHQWTYELDGRLLYARDMGPDFDAAKHGLKPVACEEAAGVVYVCLADEPPSIEPFLETRTATLRPHQLNEAKVAFESTIIENGNWKLVIENNRECYHCAGAHPGALPHLPRPAGASPRMDESGGDGAGGDRALGEVRGRGPALEVRDRAEPASGASLASRCSGRGESYTMDGKAAVPSKRLANAPFADAGSLLNFHYPNTWNHFLADHSIVFRRTADQPDRDRGHD